MSAWSDWAESLPNKVAWWRLHEETGPWLDEVSGIQAVSTGTVPPTSVPGLVAGDADRALYFGAGARLQAAMPALGDTWSWIVLFRPEAFVLPQRILAWGVNPAILIQGLHQGSQTVGFFHFSMAAQYGGLGQATLGEVHMAGVAWSRPQVRLHGDGQLLGSASPSPAPELNLSAGNLFISSFQGGAGATGQWWPGVIDEVLIVGQPLADQDFADGWAAMHTPGPPRLLTPSPAARSIAVSWEPPDA